MAVVYATLIVFPSPHGVVFSHWRRLYRVPLRISVPLRGVDCFSLKLICSWSSQSFRPLAGCRSFCKFPEESVENCDEFPSPCGVWVVSDASGKIVVKAETFPSPYGVWVVSAKLHILFGAAGKRIVNSAVLLYHIGRWFINSKLRNCKVPCEAHKTET